VCWVCAFSLLKWALNVCWLCAFSAAKSCAQHVLDVCFFCFVKKRSKVCSQMGSMRASFCALMNPRTCLCYFKHSIPYKFCAHWALSDEHFAGIECSISAEWYCREAFNLNINWSSKSSKRKAPDRGSLDQIKKWRSQSYFVRIKVLY